MSERDDIADAQDAFAAAEEHEAENRREAIADVRFGRLDDQWDEKDRADRERDGRPCLTINKLPASMRQVWNDARQNRPAIAVHPVDDGSDPDTAEILNGIIRNIEQSSDAEAAYDTALEHAVDRGFGYFAIDLAYSHDDAWDQDIVIKRISNPFSVYGDPTSTAVDSSDWNDAFILDVLNKTQFKDRFDDAEFTSFTDARELQGQRQVKQDTVVIASRWKRETVKRKIYLLSDGQVVGEDALAENQALFAATGVTVEGQPRTVPSYKVTQQLLSGSAVLETVDWAGKYIPIIPVYGEEVNEEGTRHFRSLIRAAKDGQRRYNVHISASTEATMNQTKAPWVGARGSFKSDAKNWATSNENHAYLEYDPVIQNGVMAPPPQRQPLAGVPAGDIQAAMMASDDMKAIMGIHDASLGARSNETSGVAIMARQREGDVSTFHFTDNLNRAIRHAGRILVDLIPKVYTVPRVQRIIGKDGKADLVPVNQQFEAEQEGPDGQVQKISKIYDLTTGRYDVTVKAGPSFTSRREEAATQMIELIRAYPAAAPVIGDLLARNLDWPGAEEIADRLQALLPSQLQGESPEAQEAKAAMQQMAQLIQQLQADANDKAEDRAIEGRKLEIEAFNAETDRLKVTGDQELKRLTALVGQLSGGALTAAA